MAKRTAEITLEGEKYKVHAFNMKELQELMDVLADGVPKEKIGFQIVSIAMRRAEPKANFDEIEPLLGEIGEATTAILKLSGMEPQDPQTAAPANS